jgi:3-hydroxymyristoyl/3-hydroxydecanoyl-(acyl carrier protein) dehydratase
MNILNQEIRNCMAIPVKGEGGGASATFSFPEDFTGFKGHFPTGGILPGVCKVQALVILSEFLNDNMFELEEIKEAKFFSPVLPKEEVIFDYSENIISEREVVIKAGVSCEGRKVAKIELSGFFICEEGEE